MREQLLGKLTMGTEIELEIPSLEKKVKGTVYYVRDMGDYAAWRATKSHRRVGLPHISGESTSQRTGR